MAGKTKIETDVSVDRGRLHGAALAAGYVKRMVKGGAGKKKAKSKKRLKKPPVGGWPGGDPRQNGSNK